MTNTAVVILNWNKSEKTRRCLEIGRKTTSLPVQWIVVDNGSTERLGPLPPDVVLLRKDENLGFAGGVNSGMQHAFASGAEHVWLLNNDAEPLPGALDELIFFAQTDPSIGLASSVILNSDADDAIEFHGGYWDDFSYHTTIDPAEYARWISIAPERIWLLGTALLVSRRLIEKIGYFDETLFAYWEDNDFSRRSSRAGFRNVMVARSRVRHESGHPTKHPAERPPYYYYYMTRNELKLLRREAFINQPKLLFWMMIRSLRLRRRLASLPLQRQAMLRGLADGLLGKEGAYQA